MVHGRIFAILIILLLLSPLSHAQGAVSKKDNLSNRPSVIWVKKGFKAWGGDFIVSNNYVLYYNYYEDETVLLKADNGCEIWHKNIGAEFATLYNKSVYLFGNGGGKCLGFDGNEKWNLSLYWANRFIFTSAEIIAWNIFENHVKLALISYDGKIVMEREWKNLSLATPPVASNNVIYFGAYNVTDHNKTYLYAVGTNGSVMWFRPSDYFDYSVPFNIATDREGNAYVLTIYNPEKWNLSGGYYGVYAFDKKGHLRWKIKEWVHLVSPLIRKLRVANNSLYVLIAHWLCTYIQKINITSGEIIIPLTKIDVGTHATGNHVDFDSSNNIYIVSGKDGKIYSYTENGTERWNLSLDSRIAEIRVYNDSIYALTENGFLYRLGTLPEFPRDIYTVIVPILLVLGLLILGVWKRENAKASSYR